MEEVSYSFPGGNGGAYPRSGVIFDNAGNLYGTTVGGGSQFDGVVFQLVPSGQAGRRIFFIPSKEEATEQILLAA
jgi:uncharacterized repeat protein (TIGR03803 family)